MVKIICNGWYWLNGVKQCGLVNSTGCRMSGDVKCGLYEIEPQTPPINSLYGWECPRCHQIHSPFIPSCDCPPLTRTATTIENPKEE